MEICWVLLLTCKVLLMVLVDMDSVCSKLHVLQSCSEVMKLYTSVEASCAEIRHCRVLDAA